MLGTKGLRRAVAPGIATLLAAIACGCISRAALAPRGPGAEINWTFTDTSGKVYSRDGLRRHKATVFLFVSSQCPVSNVYSPRMEALETDYAPRGVAVFGVYSDRQESLADVVRHAAAHSYTFPIIHDVGARLADDLGANVTPEAVVLDGTGAVRYRGRIDDNPVTTQVTQRDVDSALTAILAGQPVAHAAEPAFGCAIRRPGAVATAVPGAPTYAQNVAPILQAKCGYCHRAGQVAPFSLQTYRQASAWASDIARYTRLGTMPPWKPVPGYGEFMDEQQRRLTAHEATILARWAADGAPEGNPAHIPPPVHYASGWQAGKPDVVLMPSRPFHVSADGNDVYRNFVIDPRFTTDRYVSAVEVRPGNRAIVHHVIIYIDGMRASARLDGREHDGQPGFTSFGGPGFLPTGMLGGWAPGNDPHFLPSGVGNLVPKGALLVIQVHYHKDGKAESDQTRVGLHFAKGPIDKRLRGDILINWAFRIPPGDPHYEARATSTVEADEHILDVTPHMHLLGRTIKVWATLPDGTDKPLVWIKDWDFNWQATYMLKHPLAAPKGTKLHLLAYYDNSPDNPRNPNAAHPRAVTWGEQTTDEMCIAFIGATLDHEHLARTAGRSVRTAAVSP